MHCVCRTSLQTSHSPNFFHRFPRPTVCQSNPKLGNKNEVSEAEFLARAKRSNLNFPAKNLHFFACSPIELALSNKLFTRKVGKWVKANGDFSALVGRTSASSWCFSRLAVGL